MEQSEFSESNETRRIEDPVPPYPGGEVSSGTVVPEFPRDLIIYRVKFPCLAIGTAPSPNSAEIAPISFVSIPPESQKSETPVRIHSTPDPASVAIADARFSSHTASTDLIIYQTPQLGAATAATHINMSSNGALANGTHTFTLKALSHSHRGETFQWRRSTEESISILAAENCNGEDLTENQRGLKLIRERDRKTLAIFIAGPTDPSKNPRKVAGKLRFMGDVEETLPENFRLIAVLSIVSLIERGRSMASKNSSGASGIGRACMFM